MSVLVLAAGVILHIIRFPNPWMIFANALAIHMVPPAVQSVFRVAEAERKLPIYCVDTPDKKVAISFDAAWDADKKVRRDFCERY